MNIACWLAATAKLRPDAPALLTGLDLDADYRTFARRAAAVGAALARDCQIAPGDRVAVFASNCTQYLECLYGIWWMGAAAIPINAKLHGREAAWICSDAGARLAFVSDDTIEALNEVKGDLPPSMKLISLDSEAYRAMREGEGTSAPLAREVNDLAWLFYTSGTTGRPKGVMLSHGNLVAASTCYLIDVDPATPNDASLYAAPISHGAGLYNFPHTRMGGRHVVPESGGFDPDEVLNLCQCRDVWRSDHGSPPGRCRETPRRKRRGHPHHHLWWRADVSRRHSRSHRGDGAALCPDLRPG
jgi:long-chain acyl-CoA synthetase